jgi:hypothetical protein
MKKCIITSALILSLLGCVFAQDGTGTMGPAAGSFSGAVLFGRGSFLSSGLDIPSAPYSNTSWSVSGSAPYLNSVEAGYNDVSNMLGVEGKYFFTNSLALKMSGGAIFRGTPARVNLPGITDPNAPNAAWIPAYNSVQQDQRVDANLNIGADFVFPSKKYERVFPYVGLNVPLMYGRRTQYDPTITFNSDGSFVIADVGARHVEIMGFGLQSVAGIDYYLAEGLFFGFEFKPISYVYAFNRKIPAPGLEVLEADTHTWSYFSQIYFKLGFNF